MNAPAPQQLLRLPEVMRRTGLARSTIYERDVAGTFPRRIKLGSRFTVWAASEVDAWIAERIADGRPQQQQAA